jgi:hypothetical protein
MHHLSTAFFIEDSCCEFIAKLLSKNSSFPVLENKFSELVIKDRTS